MGRRNGRSFLQVLISDPAHDGLRKQLRIVGKKVSSGVWPRRVQQLDEFYAWHREPGDVAAESST